MHRLKSRLNPHTSSPSTTRDNVNHLTRRLLLWEEGKIKELVSEGRTIQAQLTASKKAMDDSTLAKRFATMVFNNNYKRNVTRN